MPAIARIYLRSATRAPNGRDAYRLAPMGWVYIFDQDTGFGAAGWNRIRTDGTLEAQPGGQISGDMTFFDQWQRDVAGDLDSINVVGVMEVGTFDPVPREVHMLGAGCSPVALRANGRYFMHHMPQDASWDDLFRTARDWGFEGTVTMHAPTDLWADENVNIRASSRAFGIAVRQGRQWERNAGFTLAAEGVAAAIPVAHAAEVGRGPEPGANPVEHVEVLDRVAERLAVDDAERVVFPDVE